MKYQIPTATEGALKEVSKEEFEAWKKEEEKKGSRVYFFRTMVEINESDLPHEIQEACRERMRAELVAVGPDEAGVVAVIPKTEKIILPGILPHPEFNPHGNRINSGGSGGHGGIH